MASEMTPAQACGEETMAEVCKALKIELQAIEGAEVPPEVETKKDQEWRAEAFGWTVILRRGPIARDRNGKDTRPVFVTPYWQGSAHKKYAPGGSATPFPIRPKVEDVLAGLMSDAASAEESFDRWCSNMGEDPDSRRALRVYESCVDTRRRLLAFLGSKTSVEGDYIRVNNAAANH